MDKTPPTYRRSKAVPPEAYIDDGLSPEEREALAPPQEKDGHSQEAVAAHKRTRLHELEHVIAPGLKKELERSNKRLKLAESQIEVLKEELKEAEDDAEELEGAIEGIIGVEQEEAAGSADDDSDSD